MSNSRLIFDPAFPLWAIALLLLAFAFFIWKEINRPQKFLVARIVSQLIILASILGLMMRPAYREPKPESSILLLTPGYEKSKADSLLKQNDSFKIIRTKDADPYLNAEALSSYHQLANIGGVKIILGQGLPDYALDLIGSTSFKFIPSPLPQGIIELDMPKRIVVNKNCSITGVFHATRATTLKLVGPAGIEDSVGIKKSGSFPFELTFKPRQSGLFLYRLEYRDNQSVISENLPLEIINGQKLRIIILQKFPTAEIRYLKNYLAEKGHALALRYQTSKTNFKYEFANRPSIPLNAITPELSKNNDLIITDGVTLEELSRSDKTVLKNAIREGLGVIILADEFTDKSKTSNQFLQFKFKTIKTDTVHLLLNTQKRNTLPVVPIEITPDANLQTILQHHGRTLSGYIYAGAGKVGFQLLRETYRINLEGNEDDYTFIWSDLIEKTARTNNATFKINVTNDFPYYPDGPLRVDIISSGAQPILRAGQNLIPLAEDVVIDNYWHGKSWAGKSGWHQFTVQDSTHLNYFVSNEGEWKTLRFANQVKSNELAQSTDSKHDSPGFITKPISTLLFYFVFLLASGFLWLAPKI